ncbi:MAG: tRNA pseudouridine(38-40) synthase TruA [Acidimicrobiia bacterium]|nr:tRNA pseudouridine(38-40) synthase TruA [Acidimicrobiia bacterium]
MRVKLTVAYLGAGFRGLAPNPGVRTVVGELQTFVSRIVGHEPELVMSGRTDAGVHAWGQVLSTDLPDDTDLGKLQRSINSVFGPEIVVREVAVTGSDFSARHDATGRTYRYQIVNREVLDPFLAATSWWIPDELSLGAMQHAAGHIVGEHDFSSFCRRPRSRLGLGVEEVEVSLVRRVRAASWTVLDPGDVLRFEIEGSAFCHQMVRSIVGFLVAVGVGKREPDEMPAVLAARDRAAAEQPAPPHGLTLWDVSYAVEVKPVS